MMRLKGLTPMLNVSDIERSLDFYREIAGFELASPRQAANDCQPIHLIETLEACDTIVCRGIEF
jgi:catechol 2,3-dioxygenase-like lactoylglutathione lyase family enzyme